MQKNVPGLRAAVGADGDAVGRVVQARGPLRAVQRPAHAAVVRQPARGRVPPDPGPGRAPGPAHLPGARHRPAVRRRVRAGGGGRPAGPPGAGRRRAWPARSRPAGPRACTCYVPIEASAARTRPRPPGPSRRGPSGSTRPWPPRRSSRRTGRARCSSTRPGRAAPPWSAAYSPRVRPGVPVSFPVAWDDLDDVDPGRLHRAHRAAAARRAATRGPGQMPAPQRAERRTWSRRATRSRSPGCRPCTRASGGPGRGVRTRDARS